MRRDVVSLCLVLWLSLKLARFTYEEGVRDGRAAAWKEVRAQARLR